MTTNSMNGAGISSGPNMYRTLSSIPSASTCVLGYQLPLFLVGESGLLMGSGKSIHIG